MNKQNYKWIIYIIGITIVLTIGVQLYWNIREYQINKQNLISKVQLSLDNSVEAYFANLTKQGIITYTSKDSLNSHEITDTIVVKTNSRYDIRKKIDSAIQNLVRADSGRPILIKNQKNNTFPFITSDNNIPKSIDSLISKVMISITRDTLDLPKLNTYLTQEFKRNNIEVTYGLKHHFSFRNEDGSVENETKEYLLDSFPKKYLTVKSNSTFLPHRTHLELLFTNETATLLRDSFISILLSLLLSISIIISILFLLKTIYKQKQLAEIKNDLISNITHELKTPIATISTALEALKNFNALNNKEKSEKYIAISNTQVEKLNIMIEKILETATLNNGDLNLNKQPINLISIVEQIIEKYKLTNPKKTIVFEKNTDTVIYNLDKFHIENAIDNILDNAVKYGGNSITIKINASKEKTSIYIKDNGEGIPKSQKDKVFEQFYRIPTGNTHNVKGFGIGLFYTKKIIESHKGTIQIIYNKHNNTIFKIDFINE